MVLTMILPMGWGMSAAKAGGPATIQLTAAASGQSINLSWNVPGTGQAIRGYYIYRGTVSGQESVYPLTDFPVTGTLHTDTPASNGTYYYIVRPVYSDSTAGAPSNEASATVGAGSPAGGITLVLQVNFTTMYKNGFALPITVPPELNEGRVFVPFRAVAEGLGGTVGYNGAEQKVTIALGGNTINLWLGKSSAVVNGQKVTLDAVPYISNGSTMVPLRFVTTNLGCQVQWDGTTQKVTISYGAGAAGTPGGSSQTPQQTPPAPPTAPVGAAVDFSGTWKITVDGEEDHNMTFTQSGDVVSGYSGYDEESGHKFSGKVTGNVLHGKLSTTNPVTEWDFKVTMTAGGDSFDGWEYYSNPPWVIHGEKVGAAASPVTYDFTGTWKLTLDGEEHYNMVLTQNGNAVSGYAGYDQSAGHQFNGTVEGNVLRGKFSTTNPVTEWQFEATMTGDGSSFDGIEYYSNPPWTVYGVKK